MAERTRPARTRSAPLLAGQTSRTAGSGDRLPVLILVLSGGTARRASVSRPSPSASCAGDGRPRPGRVTGVAVLVGSGRRGARSWRPRSGRRLMGRPPDSHDRGGGGGGGGGEWDRALFASLSGAADGRAGADAGSSRAPGRRPYRQARPRDDRDDAA